MFFSECLFPDWHTSDQIDSVLLVILGSQHPFSFDKLLAKGNVAKCFGAPCDGVVCLIRSIINLLPHCSSSMTNMWGMAFTSIRRPEIRPSDSQGVLTIT